MDPEPRPEQHGSPMVLIFRLSRRFPLTPSKQRKPVLALADECPGRRWHQQPPSPWSDWTQKKAALRRGRREKTEPLHQAPEAFGL